MPRIMRVSAGPCQAPRCNKQATTLRGFCDSHASAQRKYGHPLGKLYAEHGQGIELMRQLVAERYAGRPVLPSTIRIGNGYYPVRERDFDRFLRYTSVQAGGSWMWTGKINAHGYGIISLRRGDKTGIYIGAHRFAYELLVGPVPEGLDLDHVRHNNAHQRGECVGGMHCLHRREVDPAGLMPRSRTENVALGVHRVAPRLDTCKNGHLLAGDNLATSDVNGKSRRRCKACARERARAVAVRTGRAARSNRLTGSARDAMRGEAARRYAAGERLQDIADSVRRSKDLIRRLVIEGGGEIRPRGYRASPPSGDRRDRPRTCDGEESLREVVLADRAHFDRDDDDDRDED